MLDLMFNGTWEDLYAETDAAVKQKLVDVENDIRTMLGAETKVEEPRSSIRIVRGEIIR